MIVSMRSNSRCGSAVAWSVLATACTAFAGEADDPYADEVIEYEPGLNPTAGFTNPKTALGSPERFSGESTPFPAAVTPFSPPFGTDEIVSIGISGWLTLRFNTPVRDDPANPFGIDLIVFGNTGFIDGDFPNGIVAGVFGNDGGLIEVSENGSDWVAVPRVKADGLFPTQGWLDNTGPFDLDPGTIPSNFQLPINPAFNLNTVLGLGYEEVVNIYNGSGGGAGIDLATTGLVQISYVRIYNPLDGDSAFEIDAVVDARNPADLGHDGSVGPADLATLLAAWGPTQAGAPPDLNFDGQVNTADLAQLLAAWTTR